MALIDVSQRDRLDVPGAWIEVRPVTPTEPEEAGTKPPRQILDQFAMGGAAIAESPSPKAAGPHPAPRTPQPRL